MNQLRVELPNDITAEEARFTLAAALFTEGKLTQGQAARLAGYSRETFLELLGKHRIPFTNITIEDLDEELATWRALPSRTAPP